MAVMEMAETMEVGNEQNDNSDGRSTEMDKSCTQCTTQITAKDKC